MTSISPTVSRPASSTVMPQIFLSVMGGLLLTFLVFTSLATGYQYRHSGLIFPGVSVAGIDLAGLTHAEASDALWEQLNYPREGRIAFQDGSTIWAATPAELGLVLDAHNTALAAYRVGRSGNPISQFFTQVNALQSGKDLPPLLVYDENIARNYLVNLAATVDRPTIEANIGVDGVEVTLRSGQVGRTLDVDATLPLIGSQMNSLTDGLIPLLVHETPPVIFDASEQAEIARQILASPLTLTTPAGDGGAQVSWEIDVQTLAGMLAIERVPTADGEQYQIGVSTEYLRGFFGQYRPRNCPYSGECPLYFQR
ncbi:MAG: hypothetical protein HC806_05840 [Anaerolineae bacterium]|nr:hypothetical protein [Anaerolineae bacterium]